jgi:hypothetical protein
LLFAYSHVPDETRKNLDNKGHKCIFVGYYKDTKSYKLYDLIAIKFIINRNVQFVENEAWDGSVEKTVRIIDVSGNDDIEDEVVKTPVISQCAVPSTTGIVTHILAQTTPVRFAGAHSTLKAQQTPTRSPSTSTSQEPTLSSLLPRKTRSFHDIYNVDTTNAFSVFALF